MKCPQCGFENVDSSTHCLNCGARMDGNLICPKCGEAISPDFDRCPKCNHKIPHQPKEEPVVEYTRKDKVNSVFNKVFLIVIIVLLALTMAVVWTDYIHFVKDGVAIRGSATYFLFKSWGDMANKLSLLSDPFEKTSVYIEYITQFAVVLANITVTYLFGIIGIVLSAISLKKKGIKECRTYMYLAIVFTSNLIANVFLLANHGGSYIVQNDNIPVSTLAYFGTTATAMTLMAVFSIVIRHENGKKAPTFEKLVFGFNFILAFLMIVVFSTNYLVSKDVESSFRNGSFFLFTISEGSFLKNSPEGIALLCSAIASVIICTLEVITLSTLIIFFSQGFYTQKERSMKFKIPCYAFSVSSFLLSSVEVGISIAAVIFMNKVYGGNYYIAELAWLNIALAILLLGAGVASLSISRIYRKFERLSDQTTKK